MSPIFSSVTALPESTERRERARERLYVFFQTSSWLFMLGLQVLFAFSVSSKKVRSTEELLRDVSLITLMITSGLLISHFGRRIVYDWGWKELGWRALAPRVMATTAIQSAVWCAFGYIYPYAILRIPLPDGTVRPALLLVIWINGMFVFTGWWCVYFVYHLFDRFNRMHFEQLRLATAVKEAELRALKSQVNPHFIFNALNSLRALIDDDPSRARLAVTQLANLLRYSLQSAQAETVPFEEELRVVNDYLALEQVRHEERLRLRLDIAPETLGLAVPPLVLQTLVENAVKYGISPRPEGGEIEIVARCENGQLLLRVTNPGELASPAKNGESARSTGVGLKNAAERLKLSFGERARLQVRSERASRVVAEVSVPVQIARA